MYALLYSPYGSMFDAKVHVYDTFDEAQKDMVEDAEEHFALNELEPEDLERTSIEIGTDYAWNPDDPDSAEWHIIKVTA